MTDDHAEAKRHILSDINTVKECDEDTMRRSEASRRKVGKFIDDMPGAYYWTFGR